MPSTYDPPGIRVVEPTNALQLHTDGTAYVESVETKCAPNGETWYVWNLVYTGGVTGRDIDTHVPENHQVVRSTITSSTTTTALSGTDIWTGWNRVYCPTGSTVRQQIITTDSSSTAMAGTWNSWNAMVVHARDTGTTADTLTIRDVDVWPTWNSLPRPEQILRPTRVTEEERARRQAEDERYRRLYEEQRARAAESERLRKEAEERAERLLAQLLNEDQKRELRERNHFHLITGGKKYRVKRGWAGNIELLGADDKPVERLCVHPVKTVPIADNMAIQKLMLEANESEIRRIANITPLRRYG